MKFKCPECGARGARKEFDAFILHIYRYNGNGDITWNSVNKFGLQPDDEMRCRACRYHGPTRIFATGDDE